MIRYRYNQQVAPPAPFLSVIIAAPGEAGEGSTIPALVDSGADRTVIPTSIVAALALHQSGLVEAAGLGNAVVKLPVYVVRIIVHDRPAIETAVLAVSGEPYVLLGRDVLNRFRVILDGPGGVFSIE